MWKTATDRRGRQRRKDLLITSIQGKVTASEWAKTASEGRGEAGTAAGKIVIVGWSGEQFVAPAARSRNARQGRPVPA